MTDLDKIYNIIKEKEPIKCLLLFFSLFIYLLSTIDTNNLKIFDFVIFVLMIICLFFFNKFRKIPKRKDDVIRILIGIEPETEAEKNRIIKDFKNTFEKYLNKYVHKHLEIKFLEIYHTKKLKKIIKLKDNNDKLLKLDSQIIISGDICTRSENSKEFYILKLTTFVTHLKVPMLIKQKLSKELLKQIPKEHKILKENEYKEFEIKSKNIAYGVKFILGITHFLSGYIDTAFKMHKSIILDYKNKNIEQKEFVKIEDDLKFFLSEEAIILSKYLYNYRTVLSRQELDKFLNYINSIDSSKADYNIHYHLLLAIYHFLKNRDISSALRSLDHLNNKNDSVMYSKAFLYAYDGDLDKAFRLYSTIGSTEIKKKIKPIYLDIEIFIENVAKNERDKIQLWYLLGLLNQKIKNDSISANKYFKKFIILAEAQKILIEHQKFAKDYITKNSSKPVIV